MSVNNIYDTFLSIKITPDTKGRLEEIRDLTEQIIKNRDKINIRRSQEVNHKKNQNIPNKGRENG